MQLSYTKENSLSSFGDTFNVRLSSSQQTFDYFRGLSMLSGI
jgi:hypothetical protein